VLDPAILYLLVNPPMPPEPPRMAQEAMLLSEGAENIQRKAAQLQASFETYADDWRKKLAGIKTAANSTPGTGWTASDLSNLETIVGDVEEEAERRGKSLGAAQKRHRRKYRQIFADDPSVGAVVNTSATRLMAIEQNIIENLLDYALFLRAFIAERRADSRGGSVFDNAEELASHLDRALA